jgi:hypothetical protein
LHHHGEDIAVEHASDGHVVCGRLNACYPAYRFDKRVTVVWSGTANKGSVNVEEYQWSCFGQSL